ncbi:hypothetical protein [Bradyrhizobium sp. STM 3557]|uniref:hypothetical protein n=1 Tax=Bradyrhizobium sp. STM 3557 TaxID=578920 RepID=UPI0038903C15
MIGSSLSKWTMSYFAIAVGWLVAAEALMAGGFGFPVADLTSPDTLVIVHMVCIGWLSMAMCGALFQFVPVLVNNRLFAERWQLPALMLLALGLPVLIAAFMVLGGRLPAWLWLFPLAAGLLMAGFALVVIDLGLTIWRARPPVGPAHFVLAGLVCLCAVVALGSVFAWSLSGRGGEALDRLLGSGVPLHAIAGLGGWLTLTAMGVSYRLLSMFMLAPDIDGRRSGLTLAAGAFASALAVAGGLCAIAAQEGMAIMLGAAAVLGLAALALYGRDVVALYRSRKRRQLELNTEMAAYGFASLAAAALLGIALALTGSFAAHVGAFTFLVAFGWLSRLVLALQDRRVPHLARDLRPGDGARTDAACAGPRRRAARVEVVRRLLRQRLVRNRGSAFRTRPRVPRHRPHHDRDDDWHRSRVDPDATPHRRGTEAATAEWNADAATAVFAKLNHREEDHP